MNLSYLIPDNQYRFFADLVEPLRAAGIDVTVNKVSEHTDLILAAILPITHAWMESLRAWRKPFVLWHWDLYSFTDYAQPHWKEYLELLPQAAEIWSGSYETARELKELRGLDSALMPAWVNAAELTPPLRPGHCDDVVLFAAGGASMGKRMEWAQRACELVGYPLTITINQPLTREDYLSFITGCRVYLMPAFEESNGSIPAMEAAVAGRAVVCTDLPSCREVFGDTVYYFQPQDFRGLVAQLKRAWNEGPLPGCRERVTRLYDRDIVFPRVVRQLRGLHAELQTGPR